MFRFGRLLGLGVLFAAAGCQPVARERFADLAIVISLDGATPAGITEAATPNIDRLIASGVQSPGAVTIEPCKTLPCHTSMLTGAVLARHGVYQNDYSNPLPVPAVPTVFDYLDEAGLVSLMIAGKPKLQALRSQHIAPLEEVGTLLGQATAERVPDFVFIHSAEPDLTGHAQGWMSPDYLRAIERADAMVGEVLAWVDAGGLWPRTLIILSADHGGYGKTHTGEHPDDMLIPWIASGGAVRCGALPDGLRIHDIGPTVLYALGQRVPDDLDGVAVTALFRSTNPPKR